MIRRERLLLAVILGLGLMVRLPFLAGDFRLTNDLETYRRWARTIHTEGLTLNYASAGVDYPPALLYLLGGAAWVEAHLAEHSVPPAGDGLLTALVKLPSILADVVTAGLVAWSFPRAQTAHRILACVAYAFNPAIWYVSAVWGQTDSVYTLFLAACVAALGTGANLPAWLAYTLALGTKIQSIALAPLLVAWSLARHGVRGLAGGLAVAAAAGILLVAPWLVGGRGGDIVRAYKALPAESPRAVVSGYNLWYLLYLGRVHQVSSTLHPADLPWSYQEIGIVLFAAFAGIAVGLALRRGRGAALPAAALSLGMFVLLTQMHERYLFPALAFVMIGAAGRVATPQGADSGAEPWGVRRLWWIYGILSATFLFNLVTIASFYPAWWTNLVATPADTPLVVVLKGLSLVAALINIVVLGWLVLEMASGT